MFVLHTIPSLARRRNRRISIEFEASFLTRMEAFFVIAIRDGGTALIVANVWLEGPMHFKHCNLANIGAGDPKAKDIFGTCEHS